jgi:hypothetical protein
MGGKCASAGGADERLSPPVDVRQRTSARGAADFAHGDDDAERFVRSRNRASVCAAQRTVASGDRINLAVFVAHPARRVVKNGGEVSHRTDFEVDAPVAVGRERRRIERHKLDGGDQLRDAVGLCRLSDKDFGYVLLGGACRGGVTGRISRDGNTRRHAWIACREGESAREQQCDEGANNRTLNSTVAGFVT